MRPELPRIPARAVNVLSVAWITKLINCLEWAMNYPTGDDKTTYRNGETISALRQSGATITEAGGDNYEGYFKVIKDGDDYKIIDGSDAEAANCGYVVAGNSRLAVLKTTITGASVTTDGAFYIETTYVTSAYVRTVKFIATLPTATNSKDICLIADLKNGVIIQRLHGEHNIARWV